MAHLSFSMSHPWQSQHDRNQHLAASQSAHNLNIGYLQGIHDEDFQLTKETVESRKTTGRPFDHALVSR